MKKPGWLIVCRGFGGESIGLDELFGISRCRLRRKIHTPATRRRVPRVELAIIAAFAFLEPGEEQVDAPIAAGAVD